MFLPLSGPYTWNLHAVPPAVAGVLLAVLAAAVLIRNRASFESIIFSLMILSGILWQLSYVGLYLSADAATALRWVRLEHAGVVFIPSFLYLFASMMLRHTYRCRFYLAGCFVFSFLFLVTIFASDLFIRGVERYAWGYYARYGPAGALFVALFFLSMAANLGLYWKGWRRSGHPRRRMQFRSLFTAFAIVQLGAVDFFAVFGLPVYPLGCVPVLVFVFLLARLLWRCPLSDITVAAAAPSVFDAMRDLLFAVDRSGRIQVANRAACEFFGADIVKIAGEPVSRYLGDRFAGGLAPYTSFPAMGRPAHEQTLVRCDGTERHFRMTVYPLVHDDYGRMGMIVMASDVTEYRQARETIRTQEKQFQATIHAIPDYAILKLSPAGMIETWSAGAQQLLGYDRPQVLGRHVSLLLARSKNPGQQVSELLMEASQAGSAEYKGFWRHSDHSSLGGKMTVTTIRSESHQIVGFTAVIRGLQPAAPAGN